MLNMKRLLLAALAAAALIGVAHAAGPTTQAVNAPTAGTNNLTTYAVNMAAIGDTAIAVPSYVTSYQVTAVKIYNCSATPILASVGLYTGTAGGGTAIVTAAAITGAASASVVLTSTLATTIALSAGTLYVRVAVANAAALTCNVHVDIDDLS